MSVVGFTFLILIIYLIALKTVSYFAYKTSTHNTEDYFLARRGVGTFALIATMMASIFSTGTVVSSPSEFYTKGSGFFWIFSYIFLPLVMMPLVLKFWKLGKVKGYITPGEMLGDFYESKKVQTITAVVGLLAVLPYAAAQLVAVGKTFEALTDGAVPYALGVTIVCAAIGLYLYYGGSRAVIWTDAVQGIIFSTLLIATGYLAVRWAGGWEATMTNFVARAPEKAEFAVGLHYFEYYPICFCFLFLPYVWQRMYMAKSARIVAKNVVFLPVIFMALFFITWLIGTAGHTLFPDGLPDGDSLLGAIFATRAPYLGAFVLVAAFAAGMSTVDSQLLTAGSLCTRDVRPLIRKNRGGEFEFARRTTVLLLIGLYLWTLTLQSRSVISLIIMGVSLTVIFAPAVIGMFYWRRASSAGAFWSMTLGLTVYLVKELSPLGDAFPTPMAGVSWALIVSLTAFVGISLLTDGKKLNHKREEFSEILSPLHLVPEAAQQTAPAREKVPTYPIAS